MPPKQSRCQVSNGIAQAANTMTPDTEGLHPIANTDLPDRVADVVFIHGLGGSSHATWRHGKEGEDGHFFWPAELAKELPQCGVWSLGYAAGIIPWFGADGLPIEDRAVNLAHKLTTKGLGDRTVIFITHSMGGLMVKEIVVQSLTAGDPAWSAFVCRIAGIVFCGTPHRGADVALMAKRLAVVLRTQHHIRDMAAGTRHLERLHSRFVEWHRKHQPKTEAYTEGIGMKRSVWWLRWLPAVFAVKSGSADPQLAGCRCIPCHDDHLALVKPPGKEHDVYSGVLKFVQGVLDSLSASIVAVSPINAPPSSNDPSLIRSLIIDILREEGVLPARV
jgi:pimeloyl-ACP methyl ester carboxylesterase